MPAMIDPRLFDELSTRLAALVAASPARDIEKNAKALVGALCEKMDLVTREDFEIQVALLERAQARIKALETRLAALEKTD